MNVKLTRMELLKTKKKLKLATKGHKLLKQKRDALIMEFFSLLREIKCLRQEIAEKLLPAQNALHRANMLCGELDVERFAMGMSAGLSIDFGTRSMMGAQLLTIENVDVDNQWYGYMESTIELDDAIHHYRELFPELLKLAEKQLALYRIAEEIKKAKRKVNSLEYILIPGLEDIVKMIYFKLEKIAGENFSRLKLIKKKAEKREAQAS